MTDPKWPESPESEKTQSASVAAPDQWLVRTRQNRILGPMSRAEVLQMISHHKIGLEDEVCRANFYWFYLHEHKELTAQLGIHLPKQPRDDDEEVTETETDVLEVTPSGTGEHALGHEGTTVYSSPYREGVEEGAEPDGQRDSLIDAEEEFRRQLASGIERDSFRKLLVSLLFLLFVGLLVWMFRLLRPH